MAHKVTFHYLEGMDSTKRWLVRGPKDATILKAHKLL